MEGVGWWEGTVGGKNGEKKKVNELAPSSKVCLHVLV